MVSSSTKRVRNTTTDDFRESLAKKDDDESASPAVPATISTKDDASVLTAPESEQQTTPHHKRARDAGGDTDADAPVSRKREVSRRQTVLQLYQQHSEKLAATNSNPDKILSRLKDLYKFKVLPVERKYHMHSFCLPTHSEIYDAEFDAKPMVLLVGPYSTGKTTFIQHLIGGEFPGMHIGPEPTTDKFMALVHGDSDGVSYEEDVSLKDDSGMSPTNEDAPHFFTDGGEENEHKIPKRKKKLDGKIIKGHTLTVTPELPFASLAEFGSAFLKHFDGSVCASPLLRNLTLIDTPGVLSGEKQRLNRSYNFADATKWFADRSDLILLLFDAHKLDISDEFKQVVETIRPHNDDKIRCVLNKADTVTREQFVRVYGSLLWSMGKLFETPEVVRVYTGSYWDEPLKHDDFSSMFESDEWLLIDELMNLPSVSAERKVNAMVQRIRLVKVHVCLLGYLGRQMPRFSAQQGRVRKDLLLNLEGVFDKVCKIHKLAKGDMPNVDEFRDALEAFPDWAKFPAPDPATLKQLDHLIREEIPNIIRHSPTKKSNRRTGNGGTRAQNSISTTSKSVIAAKSIVAETGASKKKKSAVQKDLSLEATLLLAILFFFAILLTLLFVVIPRMKNEPTPLLTGGSDGIYQFIYKYALNRMQAEELYKPEEIPEPVYEF